MPLTFLVTAFLWVSNEVPLCCFAKAKGNTSCVAHLTGAAVATLVDSTAVRTGAKVSAIKVFRMWPACKRPSYKLR